MGMLPPYSYREGDVWFRGPLLESVDDKGQVVFSPEVGEVGGGCGPVGAVHISGALQIRSLRSG